jgi:hypothetical protein
MKMSARYVTMKPLNAEGGYEKRQRHCQDQNSTEDPSDADSYLEG